MKEQLDEGEVRRIQVTGRGSYIVSLPKKWVEDIGLGRGGQVVVTREDGTLTVTPRTMVKKERRNEISFAIPPKGDVESIVRRVISLYLVGYNIIRLRSTEGRLLSSVRDAIRDTVRKKLVGTEIVTESPEELTLQVLLSYPELSVEDALRRMVIITSSMQKDSMQALKEENPALAEEVIKMDDEVDRFSFYIVRQIKTAVQSTRIMKEICLYSPRECLGYRLIVKSVERAADHAVKIAENVRSVQMKIDPKLLERISEINYFSNSIFEDAIKSLFKRSYDSADEVLKRAKKIETYENEIVPEISKQKIKGSEMSSLRLILESLRRICEYGSDIAEVVLNLTAVKPPEP